jgi:hypothetical protein
MAVKKVWIGSVGPYLYDDEQELEDDDVPSGTLYRGMTTTQINLLDAPTETSHLLRLGDIGTEVQEYHANLDALASLTLANNKMLYSTGAGALSLTDLSAFSRTLLAAADADEAKDTLEVSGGGGGSYGPNVDSLDDLTLAADKVLYSTASETLALADFTSFARTLLDDSNSSIARATLELTIGTHVQAFHANLTAFAGLSLIADRLPYADGTGTLSLATLTSFGRSLIDDAAASNARTTLELGSLATLSTIGTSQLDNDAVTYAKLQNISATSRFLGRITTGAGDTEELTGTQATTLLDTFTDSLKGLVPASGGGTDNFLRADGNWAEPAGGGGGSYGVNVDELDALTLVADRLIYADDTDSLALTTFTSFARTLLDDADSSTARTTLGLVIGTNVQAQNAILQGIADTSLATNVMWFSSDGSTVSTCTLTGFARGLIDDTSASNARNTLSAVGAGTHNNNQLAYISNTREVSSIAGLALDASNSNLLLNQATVGTSGAGVLSIKNGTAPSTQPADIIQLYSADRGSTAGKASLHLITEDATSHVLGDRVGLGLTSPDFGIHIRMSDTVLAADGYGNTPNFIGRRANNTLASPTSISADAALATFGGRGYTTTSGAGFSSANRAQFNIVASENYTDTAQGAHILIGTTPIGSTTRANRLIIDGNGNLAIGTAVTTSFFGTSAVNVLTIGAGAAPSTSPADLVQMYCVDRSGGGTATLFIRNEEGHTFTVFRGAAPTASDGTLGNAVTRIGEIITHLQAMGIFA